jgi:hypothetical protein
MPASWASTLGRGDPPSSDDALGEWIEITPGVILGITADIAYQKVPHITMTARMLGRERRGEEVMR